MRSGIGKHCTAGSIPSVRSVRPLHLQYTLQIVDVFYEYLVNANYPLQHGLYSGNDRSYGIRVFDLVCRLVEKTIWRQTGRCTSAPVETSFITSIDNGVRFTPSNSLLATAENLPHQHRLDVGGHMLLVISRQRRYRRLRYVERRQVMERSHAVA